MSSEVAQVISRKDTRTYKRRLWLSPVGVFLLVSLVDFMLGRSHFFADLFAAGILAALYLFFSRRNTRFHTLADEVVDCGDQLKISKGRMQAIVPLSNIAGASLPPSPSVLSSVIIELVHSTEMGKQIEFLTESTSKIDFPEAKRIAENLNVRAAQARAAEARSSG